MKSEFFFKLVDDIELPIRLPQINFWPWKSSLTQQSKFGNYSVEPALQQRNVSKVMSGVYYGNGWRQHKCFYTFFANNASIITLT